MRYPGTRPLFAIAVVNLVYLCFWHSTDKSFYDHGGLNRMFLIGAVFFANAILGAFFLVRAAMRKHPYSTAGVLLGLFVCFSAFVIGRTHNSCDSWARGLHGQQIEPLSDTGEALCQIETPKRCTFVEWAGVFDSYRFSLPCEWQN